MSSCAWYSPKEWISKVGRKGRQVTSTFVRQTRENTFLMVLNSGAHSKELWVLRDGLVSELPSLPCRELP